MASPTVLAQILTLLTRSKMLSGKERYAIEAVHPKFAMLVRARPLFQSWLQGEENGVGTGCCSLKRMYSEYLASHLQRCFLRRLQCLSTSPQKSKLTPKMAACLGSSATQAYLQQDSFAPPWQAHDIDIFVLSESYANEIVKMYATQVGEPLGVLLDITEHLWHFSDDGPVLNRHFSDNIRTQSRKSAIAVVRNSVETFIEDMPVDNRTSEWIDELRMLPEYLPGAFIQRPYDVLLSLLVVPVRNTKFLPAVLKPLNVIVIKARGEGPAIDSLEAM